MATATGAQHNNKYELSKSRSSFGKGLAASLVENAPTQSELADAVREGAREGRRENSLSNRDEQIETFEKPRPAGQYSAQGAVPQDGSMYVGPSRTATSRRKELEGINLEHITDPSYRARAAAHLKRQAAHIAKEEAKKIALDWAVKTLKAHELDDFAELLEDEEFLDTAYEAASKSAKGDHSTTKAIAKAIATFAISAYTGGLWTTWQWTSIATVITGVGIFNFMAATAASWVALADTLFHPFFVKSIGKIAAAALPPSFSFLPGVGASFADKKFKLTFSKASAGLSEFGFFLTAHALWFLIIIALAAVIFITILPVMIPFFAPEIITKAVTGS